MEVNGKELDWLNTAFYKICMFLWEFVGKIATLESNIAVAAIGSAGGALGAAWWLNNRDKKKELKKEIQNTNAAIGMAFGVTNTYCTFKDQLVNPITTNYARASEQLDAHHNAVADGGNPVFEFEADFRFLTPPLNTSFELHSQLYEKLTIVGRPLHCLITLQQTIHSLHTSILHRNQLINNAKAQQLQDLALSAFYFGLVDAEGNTDESYPNVMKSIQELTDDCIFYSNLLAEDLGIHGKILQKEYGRNAPKVMRIHLHDKTKETLLPSGENHQDILSWKYPA